MSDYKPPRQWTPPVMKTEINPEQIGRLCGDIAFQARCSYEAGKLLREVLGPNSEELHWADEIILKSEHR